MSEQTRLAGWHPDAFQIAAICCLIVAVALPAIFALNPAWTSAMLAGPEIRYLLVGLAGAAVALLLIVLYVFVETIRFNRLLRRHT
jgi:hypothetical protein